MTRKTLLSLHRWVGLALGALLLVQALTGTAMVFRDEIEPVIHPGLQVERGGERLPLQQLVDTVRATRPGATLQRFEWMKGGGAVLFRLLDEEGEPLLMALDPHTGAILREGGLAAWPTEWMFHLHDQLLSGKAGEWIIGIAGLGLIFIAVTGPIVWWPGRKRLKSGFRVIRGAGADRLLRSLHRAAGAALALFILVSATTGVTMIFKANFQPLLVRAEAYVPKPAVKIAPRPDASRVPVDALIAKARRDYGPSELMEVRFQGEDSQVVLVYLRDDASARENASKQIYFNAYDAREVGHYVPSALPSGNSFIDWQFPIHTGRQAGVIGRLLILSGGLGLIFFTTSGLWLWLSSRRQRKARALKRSARLATEGRG
jgi:uncharacterized iron-regulated membrane protein